MLIAIWRIKSDLWPLVISEVSVIDSLIYMYIFLVVCKAYFLQQSNGLLTPTMIHQPLVCSRQFDMNHCIIFPPICMNHRLDVYLACKAVCVTWSQHPIKASQLASGSDFDFTLSSSDSSNVGVFVTRGLRDRRKLRFFLRGCNHE